MFTLLFSILLIYGVWKVNNICALNFELKWRGCFDDFVVVVVCQRKSTCMLPWIILNGLRLGYELSMQFYGVIEAIAGTSKDRLDIWLFFIVHLIGKICIIR